MKKIIALVCALLMILSLAACGSSEQAVPETTSPESAAPEATEAASEDTASEKTYVIGICQICQHVALDAATEGFKDALVEKLGDKVSFVEQNASNDSATCAVICNQFVSDEVDLIMANATPSLLAAASATAEIPILGTSVTSYPNTLQIEDWNGSTGMNISGTSDLAPLDGQADMIKELFPEAKTVGLLYCSGEPNSIYQVDTITPMLEELGFEVKNFSFADSNDIAMVTENACGECDVLYIPTDNTAASCTEAINNVALPNGVPIVCGESGIASGCGVATLSISYYDLGWATGEMAYRILVEGEDVSTMDIEFAPKFTKLYNADICSALNITVPDDYSVIE